MWNTTATATNLTLEPCDDYSDCAPLNLVCKNEICQSCDNDPAQCYEDDRVCDSYHCVYAYECDPYDMWDLDCFPLTCDFGTLMCASCSYNPTQCPPTYWCDYYSGECVPIPQK